MGIIFYFCKTLHSSYFPFQPFNIFCIGCGPHWLKCGSCKYLGFCSSDYWRRRPAGAVVRQWCVSCNAQICIHGITFHLATVGTCSHCSRIVTTSYGSITTFWYSLLSRLSVYFLAYSAYRIIVKLRYQFGDQSLHSCHCCNIKICDQLLFFLNHSHCHKT